MQVEKEVEPDTRIRRNFRNVRGQHNVACWEWVGPAGTKFESIGVSLRAFCARLNQANACSLHALDVAIVGCAKVSLNFALFQ